MISVYNGITWPTRVRNQNINSMHGDVSPALLDKAVKIAAKI